LKIGVTFPQTEIGSDPALVRDYAQAAEALGYHHLVAYDHVVGADVTSRPNWRGYTHESMFHEPFVLFAYLAGLTRSIELVSGVLILPQRQTVLVAKQAAAVDVLSGGRLRLGVGLGWNAVEYESLNEDFHSRGRRVTERIALMRALWTQPVVDFQGRWHRVDRAGLNPLPVQRPIPVWMGGMSEAALKRAARIADGWFPIFRPAVEVRDLVARLREYARGAGRDPATLGIQAQANVGRGSPEDWLADLEQWREIGADYVCVNTMGAGFASPREHIDAIRRYREAVGELVR